jgi:hypothetical protein
VLFFLSSSELLELLLELLLPGILGPKRFFLTFFMYWMNNQNESIRSEKCSKSASARATLVFMFSAAKAEKQNASKGAPKATAMRLMRAYISLS